ncbi:MAG: hypothetical protein ACOX6L_02760 [Syntrophomonadaceae bacterium]|jgi:hypothetical protein
MKRILLLVLALLLVPAFSTVALAADLPQQNPLQMTLSQPTQAEIDKARERDFKTIEVLTENIDGSGDFAGIEWINQSNYANVQITKKYKTMVFEFQIGPYKGHIDGAQFRTPGAPGEEIIDKVTITREALIDCYANQDARKAVEEAIDTEAFLYIRALIVIYYDANGDGIAQSSEIRELITQKNEINAKALGFAEKYKQDMRSRFQDIPINGSKRPDFYPTPEGSSEWDESYLECAATYTGEPGEEITFPVNLYNIGTKGSTDYRAVWGGKGNDPSTGWKGDNPPFKATDTKDGEETDLITLDKGESKTFEVTVVVPEQTSKLYFLANTDKNTPKTEQIQENNMMVIIIEPEGIDLAMSSPKIMQAGAREGQKATIAVPLTSFRNDIKDKPVEGEINWKWTKVDETTVIESGGKTVTLSPGDRDQISVAVSGYPGDTFWVIGEIMPTVDHDVDLSNNITKTKVYITLIKPPITPPATKEDPSPGTRVNLRD